MMYFIYIILALAATTAGSITGMGGGVIMKPVMDLAGHFNAATIGFLCAVTSFAMAVMSYFRQKGVKTETSPLKLVLLGAGSAAGGFFGQFFFEMVEKAADNDALVKIIQNIALFILIVIIFIYMLNLSKIKRLSLKHSVFYVLTGLFLGIISSFLSIGGGPINVAVLMLLFSMDIKAAAFSSIITILFAQASKITTILITEGVSGSWFASYNLSVLPYMVIAGLAGAFIGSLIKKKISGKTLLLCFNILQLIIAAICVMNIVKYSIQAF